MTVYRRGERIAPKRRVAVQRRPFFRQQGRRPGSRSIPMNPEKMKILMFSRTPVAGVAVQLRDMINKYTPHECKAAVGGAGYRDGRRWGPPDALLRDVRATSELMAWADVVMVHNGHVGRQFSRMLVHRRALCMYHSEPHRVDRGLERTGVPTYVIAQGHALLYKTRPVLPNIVDVEHPLLMPSGLAHRNGEKFRLGWAPSNRNSLEMETRRRNPYSAKGWPETRSKLDKLAETGQIEFEIFEGVPFEECMRRRQGFDIMLDEVVTGSYHRCTLEACSQGQVAINAVRDDVMKLVVEIAGAEPPWVRSSPRELVGDVLQLISEPDRLAEHQAASRAWVEKHWHPKDLLERYYIPAFRGAKVM